MEERPFHVELDEGERVLVVSGLLDEISAPELRDAVVVATSDHRRSLAVDLSDVDFLPSVAIGILVAAMEATARHGATVTLVAASGSMAERVLQVCGVGSVPARSA